MTSRFNLNARVNQTLSHLQALTMLEQDSTVDTLWEQLQSDVHNEGFAAGVTSSSPYTCIPAALHATPLERIYRAGFCDGLQHRTAPQPSCFATSPIAAGSSLAVAS